MIDPAATPSPDGVLDWGARNHRDLPWRRSRDPWEVLVSEVMLQQTQVARVLDRWRRFLDRWPDTAACAAAPLGDVLVEWQGLGYPRRARALHETARQVQQDHEGRFPDRLDELLALPGVGPYTARAVLAFAFERDVGVLDTNVGRILARHSGAALRPAEAQSMADDWVPPGRGWAWNQTMLDLGAGRCRPRDPQCDDCPLAATCAWHLAGRPDPDPASGSAAVSRPQARFDGSLRQARGRLLAAVAEHGSLTITGLETIADLGGRADEVVDSLVRDGLLVRTEGGVLRLPG